MKIVLIIVAWLSIGIWDAGALIATRKASGGCTERVTQGRTAEALVIGLLGPLSFLPVMLISDGFYHGWDITQGLACDRK